MVIVQSQNGTVSQFTLAGQPNDANVLVLFAAPGAAPYGCASSWFLVASSPDEWRGVGPFNGMIVRVTSGRTPPLIDAVIMEIG